MIQEDKQLLLADLSARLPYGVKIKVRSNDTRTVRMVDMVDGIVHFAESDSISPFGVHIEHPLTFRQVIKPYLRQMSSMTEEEKVQLSQYACIGEDLNGEFIDEVQRKDCAAYIDWLNNHHFDYRGLIEKGLAIEVTEDNNPYEN